MARHFIKNVRAVEGRAVESEYDYGGNTRVLASGERIEVSFDEAQTALGRLRDGIVYEEEPDPVVADPEPIAEAAATAVATIPAAPVADVPAEKPTE